MCRCAREDVVDHREGVEGGGGYNFFSHHPDNTFMLKLTQGKQYVLLPPPPPLSRIGNILLHLTGHFVTQFLRPSVFQHVTHSLSDYITPSQKTTLLKKKGRDDHILGS